MITFMSIKNFKSIRELNIPLSKLTVLSGMNSSGKSSVIQGIRILERFNHKKTPILLPGSGDLRHMARIPSKAVFFSCNRTLGAAKEIKSSYIAQASEFISCDASTAASLPGAYPVFDDIMKAREDEGYPNCVYIGADRLGPRNFLPTKDSSENMYDFGENCEYLYEFIERFWDAPVMPVVRHPHSRGDTLNYNIIGWLQEISPGTDFQISESDRRHGILTADFNGHAPIHVGFGLSCVLPIIVAALGATIPYPATNLPILLIENPEAHLHPQGQTKIAELIALATKNGMQVVIETHSDHFIDGIRLAVKEKQIDRNDVAIHYFSKNDEQGTTIESPVLDENGKLSFWPEGFGDQMMINRARLARK